MKYQNSLWSISVFSQFVDGALVWTFLHATPRRHCLENLSQNIATCGQHNSCTEVFSILTSYNSIKDIIVVSLCAIVFQQTELKDEKKARDDADKRVCSIVTVMQLRYKVFRNSFTFWHFSQKYIKYTLYLWFDYKGYSFFYSFFEFWLCARNHANSIFNTYELIS